MTEFYPAQVEKQLAETVTRLARSPQVRRDLDKARREAKRALDVAEAKALLAASGTVSEKQAQVVLAVQEEREAFDEAEVAYRYAENQARNLESEQSSWQTILRSVLATYNAAGVGA